ncbi:SDR family NAD(P)-dependent oxidoreductase [Klebsiella sp. S69]|uniref:SDR family NAD(P)-dependent oxidoreductase n=1 Tax=Klebsiella sp. S69 TaxID=2767439 RepID=UPI001905A773|nr:SDR family NAD(P)-dependent oxidoreductase [Klebsiella sp. S69]MBK0167437.1 SDR family NAD(P)-dependent oxidoreductase [Klebsiella sp. S69]
MFTAAKKTILITGASDGVGKETATTLAGQGHTVIIHGRDPKKSRTALEEIRTRSGNPDVHLFLADFLSFAGVKAFAEEIKRNFDHLDVLINNAGAQFSDTREETKDGHEKTMVINVFSPLLLTTLLLDLLKTSPSARVVTVSSDSHKIAKPDLNDIELTRGYSMPRAYANSKLYIIWVMNHFASELRQTGITNVAFNCVHPGSTQSSLGREATKSLKWKILFSLWWFMLIPLDKAAGSSIYAATAPEISGLSGKYYGPKGVETPSARHYSAGNERKVWEYARSVISPYLS